MHGHRDHIGFVRHFLTFLLALLAHLAASPPLVAQFGAVGLSGVGGQRFANENLIFFVPEEGDQLGFALTVGDFNGDGADDLAASVPHDDNLGGSTEDSGIVVVRYGILGSGLDGDLADEVLSQAYGDSPDPAEVGDLFGRALAACDINGDGFDDLAVGIPLEDHLGEVNAGGVQIHFGWFPGLPGAGDTFITQSSTGIPGDVEAGNGFGQALACGDFDADGFDDLAIGIPGMHVGTNFAGSVVIVRGGPFPLDLQTSYAFHQDSPGMVDQAEFNDSFGLALASGDFDGDGFADLAVGVPLETDGSQVRCGGVHLIFGSDGGLAAPGNQLWTEATLGGACIADDNFGRNLATGDLDGDGHDDLLIGVAAKDFNSGTIANAGQAEVVYGAAAGFDLSRTQFWMEQIIHGPGTTESGDHFGASLIAADFDGDGADDVAIGHPDEFQLVANDGGVTVLMGGGAGLSAVRRHGLLAGYYGHPGVANQPGRQYGGSVAAGDFDGDGFADLVIGAAGEDEGGLENVGALVVLYGSLFADGFDSQGAGFWSGLLP